MNSSEGIVQVYRGSIIRMTVCIGVVLVAFVASCSVLQACTAFFAFDGRVAIAGQNEDWDDTNTQYWSVPKTSTTLGVLYFGFGRGNYPQGGIRISPRVRRAQELIRGGANPSKMLETLTEDDLYGLPQQGINEKGLFFGGAQTEAVDARSRPGAVRYDGHIVDLIMRTCETVAEALKVLGANDYIMPAGNVLFGDKSGDSFVLEPGNVIIPGSGGHQVITNFLQSKEPNEKRVDRRYRIVDGGLGRGSRLSREVATALLQAAQQSITQYSIVIDLTHATVIVYRDRQFEHGIELDVNAELNKGPHAVRIRDLFGNAIR
jgi:hypothetical protein